MLDIHRTGDEDGGEDADGYSVVSNDGGAEFNALRYLHTHSHLDRHTDTDGDALVHAHQHSHAGLRHGHEHTHSDRNIQHHSPDDHDEAATSTT